MKLAGVQSRSSWKELAVSNVFSAALMAGFVNSLKYTTRETRPDNTSNNSFPSGHTATAFMCATILHKEYGMKSPGTASEDIHWPELRELHVSLITGTGSAMYL